MEAAATFKKESVNPEGKLKTAVICSHCNGTGICSDEKCPICKAEGEIFKIWLCHLYKGAGSIPN